MTSALKFNETTGVTTHVGFMKSLEHDGGEAKTPATNSENEEYVVSKSSKTDGFRLIKDNLLPNSPVILDFKEEPNVFNSKMKTLDGTIDIIAKNQYFCVKTYNLENLKHWLEIMKNVKVVHKKLKMHVPFVLEDASAEQEQLLNLMVDRVPENDKKKNISIRFCSKGSENGTVSLVISSANGDVLLDFEVEKSDRKLIYKQFVQAVKILKNRKLIVKMYLNWADGAADNLKLDDFFAQMGWPCFGEKMVAILKKPEAMQYQYKKALGTFDVKDVTSHTYNVESKFDKDTNVYTFVI